MDLTIEDLKNVGFTAVDLTNPVFPFVTLDNGLSLVLNWDGVMTTERLLTMLAEHKAWRETRIATAEATKLEAVTKATEELAAIVAAITEAEKIADPAEAVVKP